MFAKCYNTLCSADSTTRSSRTLSELRSRTGQDKERWDRARRGLESVLIPCPNTVIESNEARAGQLFAALLLPADVFHPGEILPYTIRGTHYDYETTSKHASSSPPPPPHGVFIREIDTFGRFDCLISGIRKQDPSKAGSNVYKFEKGLFYSTFVDGYCILFKKLYGNTIKLHYYDMTTM